MKQENRSRNKDAMKEFVQHFLSAKTLAIRAERGKKTKTFLRILDWFRIITFYLANSSSPWEEPARSRVRLRSAHFLWSCRVYSDFEHVIYMSCNWHKHKEKIYTFYGSVQWDYFVLECVQWGIVYSQTLLREQHPSESLSKNRRIEDIFQPINT